MLEALLTVALVAGLPIVYLHGKRAGFERHHCVQVTGAAGPRPADVRRRAMSGLRLPVECALHVAGRSPAGCLRSPRRSMPTDLEHHTLTHIDEVRRNPPESRGRARCWRRAGRTAERSSAITARPGIVAAGPRGRSSVAELQLPKLIARVRFSSPAPGSTFPPAQLTGGGRSRPAASPTPHRVDWPT